MAAFHIKLYNPTTVIHLLVCLLAELTCLAGNYMLSTSKQAFRKRMGHKSFDVSSTNGSKNRFVLKTNHSNKLPEASGTSASYLFHS
jgi:hypothetical protein